MGNSAPSSGFHSRPSGSPPSKSHRVIIIGAGPAGIHMGARLKKLGYENVTILERTQKIGGKSKLVTMDGVFHELGASFCTPDFQEVKNLVSEYGLGAIAKPHGDVQIHVAKRSLRLPEYISGNFSERSGMNCCEELRDVLAGINKYCEIHQELMGDYPGKVPPKPKQSTMKEINTSFGKFLKKNGLSILIPLVQFCFSGQGFGYLDEVPALYGLWWCTPSLIRSFLQPQDELNIPLFGMLPSGFQTLWQRMYFRDKLNVKFGIDIKSIDRSGKETNTPIQIEAVDHYNEKVQFECDFLILACPLKDILKYLDATEFEKEVFNSITYYGLSYVLYESALQEKEETFLHFWPENLNKENDGHIFAEKNSLIAMKWEDIDKHKVRRCVASQFFQNPEAMTEDGVQNMVIKDLQARGIEDAKILDISCIKFFPHFNQEGINCLYPWRLLEYQGSQRTWYIGSSASFDTIKDVLAYNNLLLELFLRQMPIVPLEIE